MNPIPGPTDQLLDLADFLRQVLGELYWEADNLAENFKAAVAVLDDAEAQNIARLQAMVAEIEAGCPDSADFDSISPRSRS